MSESRRDRIRQIASQAVRDDRPARWFEEVYATAEGDSQAIPWAMMQANPHLQRWLQENDIDGEGQRALVVGCGLGDDAEALSQWGFAVTAFDISETAVSWCQQRFPESSVDYRVADLFEISQVEAGRFDLVFESRTVQSLPLKVRQQTIEAIANFLAPQGRLFLITNVRDSEAEPDGPPWRLSEGELGEFVRCGLREVRRSRHKGNNRPTLCVEYRRG